MTSATDFLKRRGVWIVAMDGLVTEAMPPAGSEIVENLRLLTHLFVVLDAGTGEFLYAEWQE